MHSRMGIHTTLLHSCLFFSSICFTDQFWNVSSDSKFFHTTYAKTHPNSCSWCDFAIAIIDCLVASRERPGRWCNVVTRNQDTLIDFRGIGHSWGSTSSRPPLRALPNIVIHRVPRKCGSGDPETPTRAVAVIDFCIIISVGWCKDPRNYGIVGHANLRCALILKFLMLINIMPTSYHHSSCEAMMVFRE